MRALQAWLEAAKIIEGAVFRPIERWSNRIEPRALEDRRVATLLQSLVKRAGASPEELCRALAPQRSHHGRWGRQRARHDGTTRHKSVKQVRRYIQRGSLFRDNAAQYTGV